MLNFLKKKIDNLWKDTSARCTASMKYDIFIVEFDVCQGCKIFQTDISGRAHIYFKNSHGRHNLFNEIYIC